MTVKGLKEGAGVIIVQGPGTSVLMGVEHGSAGKTPGGPGPIRIGVGRKIWGGKSTAQVHWEGGKGLIKYIQEDSGLGWGGSKV